MIDSVFSKSMLPNGTFAPIRSMARAERKSVMQNVLNNRASRLYGVPKPPSPHRLELNRIKQKYTDRKTAQDTIKQNLGRSTAPNRSKMNIMGQGMMAAAISGSKRDAHKILFKDDAITAANPRLLAHEMQHLRPKRSGWRLAEVLSDSKKLGREEARADYMSGASLATRPNRASSSIYSKLADEYRNGRPYEMSHPLLGSNPKKFVRSYSQQQAEFERKGLRSGSTFRADIKYARKNFGENPSRSFNRRVAALRDEDQRELAIGLGTTGSKAQRAYNDFDIDAFDRYTNAAESRSAKIEALRHKNRGRR